MSRHHPSPLFRPSRLALLLAVSYPCVGWADGALTLDPVVVTGSRVETRSFDLPAAIEVVDAARINADQARVNASEALAGVPGISVANRQNYAQDLQISSRGFGARSAFGVRGVRLVADGIPASMPDGQGQAATFNLDRAERLEVMRGPMSAVYGNSAGGVIQLFTREGKGRPSVEGGFSAGSYGSWKADLAADGQAGGVGYVLDASRFATEGYRDHSRAERDQLLAKLSLAPSDDGKLTLVASSFRQEAQDPLGLSWASYLRDPRSVDPSALQFNTRKSIDQQQGGLNYVHRFGEQRVEVSAYAGKRAVTQYQSIPTGVQGNPRHSGGVIDFDRDYMGVNARWIGRFAVAGGALTTTVGVDYEESEDDRRGYENFVGSTLGVKGRLRRAETDKVSSFDQYAQAEWASGNWVVNGGLRHSRVAFKVDDRYISGVNGDDSGGRNYEKTTPSVGVLYRLTPVVNLYASAARGFETPTLNELFYSGSGGAFNFGLDAATSTHYEAGLKAWVGNDSRLDVALFEIQTNKELVVDSALGGRTSYKNAGQTTRQGVEVALDSRWAHNFTSRIAYTYLDARYDEAFVTRIYNPATSSVQNATVAPGRRLPGVAAHSLFGELVWRHPGSGFHAAVEGVARSEVFVEDSNTLQAAPGYVAANLRAGIEKRMGPLRMNGFVRVDNLFDRQYVGSVIVGDTNGRFYEGAPGRNWLAGVSARYSF